MQGNHRPVQRLIASSLLVSLLGLSACGKKNEEAGQQAAADTAAASVTTAASAAQPASATLAAYTPPNADQLYQMVAPIALFPDKLVALVLAGSTYPDQIAAANTWLTQNPNLKGQALVTSADQQPWDPSVKALTAFPAALSQMATNMTWTASLGQAYYNDPNDVLNAIQVMRQRAQASGNLCTTGEMRVTHAPRTAVPKDYLPAPAVPNVYEGPAVIAAPAQTIVIAPAQPDVVYVPSYNPAVVYGAPVAAYPGYIYHPPVYGPGAVVTGSVISFGIGIAVGAVFGHVGWGWHAWDMHWGGPPTGVRGGPGWSGWQRPAVVYNHTTYISRSTTVINRIDNPRIANSYGGMVNNAFAHNSAPQAAVMEQRHAQQPGIGMRPSAPMTMPRFSANDARPGARPSPRFGPDHANVMATNRTLTPALHGNSVKAFAQPEGHVEGPPQIERQQMPRATPQYASRSGHDRPLAEPAQPPKVETMQHRENAEPHLQAPHADFAQAHAAGLRQDGQRFAQPRLQPQAPHTQQRPVPSTPHATAPGSVAHRTEFHRYRS